MSKPCLVLCLVLQKICLVILNNSLPPSLFSECGDNTYGWRCQQTCGNCSNGEPCHHVNGTCPFGCDAGVYGKKCDIGSTISLSNVTFETTVVSFLITVKSLLNIFLIHYIGLPVHFPQAIDIRK